MLVAVASNLENDASLVAATHVCHLWRTILLSSPCLWTHLDFANETRALVFLERSKLASLRVDMTCGYPLEIAEELLNKIAPRVNKLRAIHDSFLDELLAQPMPILDDLEITYCDELPEEKPIQHLSSLTSLVISGFGPLKFHAPLLTSLRITSDSPTSPLEWTVNILLDFLRSCPLLEVFFLRCDNMDSDPNLASDDVVSLPLLHSFTHESLGRRYRLCLFDRLSLPPTCRVVLMIDVTKDGFDPWVPGLPTPRNPSYLSDVKTVKISAYSRYWNVREEHIVFGIELVGFAHASISFNRLSYHDKRPSHFRNDWLFDVLETVDFGSVQTLCFDGYPVPTETELPQLAPEHIAEELRKFRNLKTLILAGCNTTFPLDDTSSCPTLDTLIVYSTYPTGRRTPSGLSILDKVRKFAVSRKNAGSPLEVLTLVFPFAESQPPELEELTSFVGLVEVVIGNDASCWDVDEYLLGSTTHKDDVSGF